jgi:hypothetical protein
MLFYTPSLYVLCNNKQLYLLATTGDQFPLGVLQHHKTERDVHGYLRRIRSSWALCYLSAEQVELVQNVHPNMDSRLSSRSILDNKSGFLSH